MRGKGLAGKRQIGNRQRRLDHARRSRRGFDWTILLYLIAALVVVAVALQWAGVIAIPRFW